MKKRFHNDPEMEVVFKFMGGAVVLLYFMLALTQCESGCTPYQKQLFKDSFVSTADCSFHTSLACASQAMSGCDRVDSPGGSYKEFGDCLVTRSTSCAGKGLSMCLLGGMANVAGGIFAAGGVGCSGQESVDEIKACVRDAEMETEAEAVQAVAYCTRKVCMEEK
tara:strand:- start:49 stop:543 length:495 start_codon:yes stop_codon:yes gene_type:complete